MADETEQAAAHLQARQAASRSAAHALSIEQLREADGTITRALQGDPVGTVIYAD